MKIITNLTKNSTDKKYLGEEEVIHNNQYTHLERSNSFNYYKPTSVISPQNPNYKYYESKADKNVSVELYLQTITPHLFDLIDNHKDTRHKIQLVMSIFYINPEYE